MKKLLGSLLITLIVISCGTPSGQFRLEGRFRNLNQGEFYIYSLSDGRVRLDTIHVNDGRFAYETFVDDTVTYSLIFPNFSEIPIFAESGTSVDIQGDASHLKEVKVDGTEENELMTAFRLKVAEQTPPQALSSAERFIRENPKTLCALYLLQKYYLLKAEADYQKAGELTALLVKAQPGNQQLRRLQSRLKQLKTYQTGTKLPKFSAVDVRGQRADNAVLTGDLNVITVWASWNYESQSTLRLLRTQKKNYGQRLGLLSICLDASQKDCRKSMDRDSITWHTVCDGRMWDTPLLHQLGLGDVPSNILTDRQGKVLACNLDQAGLREKIKEILK